MKAPSTRYFNSLLQALREAVSYSEFSDELKKSFDQGLTNIPIDDKALESYIKKLLPDKAESILNHAKETVLKKNHEDNLDSNILKILDASEPEHHYLDLGFAGGNWYYGFLLNKREAVILSSGKILRNIIQVFKEHTIGENEIKKTF